MNQIKTYRYKLKPTKAQEQQLEQWLGTCRYVYNLALTYKMTLWSHYKLPVGLYQVQHELSAIAKETSWIKDVHSQTRQDVIQRLFTAYDGFLKQGKGFPKFAKKEKYRSFSFQQKVKITPESIYLPKFGSIRYYKNQRFTSPIKKATVCKRADGWYICLCVETDIQPLPESPNHIGIDVGIKSLLVTSDGETIENPKHLYKAEKKLKRLQRSASRKKKGSNNRKKAVQRLARQHQRVANTRKDFQHKLTTRLIRENQAITVERLQIQNMVANHHLAKSISDAGWYQLTQMLEYKAKWYGRSFEKVNARHTSQDCSACGYRNSGMTLSIRQWTCPSCGGQHDRDINAAINIKNRAGGHPVLASEIYNPVTGVADESQL